MKRNNKRAFTIVELVIVIAVIAILATVLVPTFGNVISKANDSKALQEAKNAYTEYLIANNGSAAEFMIYSKDGRWVALHNGAPIGVYEGREEAVAALKLAEDKFVDSGDEKLWVYDENVVTDTDWSGAKAVFVGDSITAATQHTSKFYFEYVKELLDLDTATGRGLSSSCISDNCTNADVSSLYDRYRNGNIPANQDLIVIFMGTNDYGHAAELGTESSSDPDNFYGALNTILPYLVEDHPNSQIVVLTPLHRDGFKSSGLNNYGCDDGAKNDAGYVLSEYVDALKNVCAKNNIPVVDLYTLITLNPTDKTYFNDGLHPNIKGHEEIAKVVADELKKIPRKERNDTEPVVESDFVNGNQFSANNTEDTHSATAIVNLWLTKGTVVKIKDNTNYQWALAPTTGKDVKILKSGAYYHATGWTSDASCTINDTGWYGFIMKIKDGVTGVNFLDVTDKKVTDFFEVIKPTENPDYLGLKHGNKHTSNDTAYYTNKYTASSVVNIWLEAGTIVKIKDNSTYDWTLLKTADATAEKGLTGQGDGASYYPVSGWFTNDKTNNGEWCEVETAGYYGFIFKFASGNGVVDITERNLLDYFEIITPDAP